MRKGLYGGIAALLLLSLLLGIYWFWGSGHLFGKGSELSTGEGSQPAQRDGKGPTGTSAAGHEDSSPELKPYTREGLLIAAGDIMMHNTQTEAGYDRKTGVYSFDSFFTNVAPMLTQGDWVTGNLETPLAKGLKYTGYPMFNAPPELAHSLKKAGFTVLTNANNHAMDRGEKGILLTREALREEGILTTGTAGNQAEREEILLATKNEITLAFLAYTYGTNGIPLPKGKDYLVSLIDKDRMKEEIKKARALGADAVVMSIHFGQEYQRLPNEEQRALVRELIVAGADIILGSHPHVVQPVQEIIAQDETGRQRKGVVIYSLGNFIAAQNGRFTNLGLLFSVGIRKHFPSGEVEITKVETTPTFIQHYRKSGKRAYRVLPLPLTNQRKDPYLTAAILKQAATDYKEMESHLQSLPAFTLTQAAETAGK